MANKKKLEAKLRKLRTKLTLQRSDSVIEINSLKYNLHFAELNLEAVKEENKTLRAKVAELEKVKAQNAFETELLKGLSTPETELTAEDWDDIREKVNKNLTGT